MTEGLGEEQRARLRANLRGVRERIDAAAARAGRDPAAVRLVAVTKYVGAEVVAALADAGQRDIGESRVAAAVAKAARVAELGAAPIRWHMVGHLQRNKAKDAAGLFSVLHSLDSADLAERLARRAAEEPSAPGCREVFVEVNIGEEPQKSGVLPADVPAFVREVAAAEAAGGIELVGLMAIPPGAADAEAVRPSFRALRELLERVNAERTGAGHKPLLRLSMGMSADFEAAVEEGATDVRVGRILFEGIERPEDGVNTGG